MTAVSKAENVILRQYFETVNLQHNQFVVGSQRWS